jgi:hypothetical protein
MEAFGVCKAVEHWRYYLGSCSNVLVGTDHDTLRHLHMQPNNMLNKRQARYLRDLQSFVGTITFVYRKGAMNEVDPLCRRPDFVHHAAVSLFGNGVVP